MKYIVELIAMIFSELLIVGLLFFTRKEKRGNRKNIFILILLLMFIWTSSMIMQILCQNTDIDPYHFEKFSTFGAVPMSLAVLFWGMTLAKPKFKFKWYYSFLFIVPIVTIIIALTNDYHHLFIVEYSTMVSETIVGPYFPIHSICSYLYIFIGIIYLIRSSVKTSGFFSKQSMMILTGTLIPVVINILATYSILNLSVYVTPVSYSIAVLFYALAIFKFKFLSITPVALQKIVDRISDGYLVLNEDNVITDFNQTYLEIFGQKAENVRNKNVYKYLKENNIEPEKYERAFEKIQNSSETVKFEQKVSKVNKYFTVEINTIFQKKEFLGKLILFKDITQHKEDMLEVRRNQDMAIERERLASLGQMIGRNSTQLKNSNNVNFRRYRRNIRFSKRI